MAALDRLNPVARLAFAGLLAAPVLITLDWVSALSMLTLEVVALRLVGVRLRQMARRLVPVTVIAAIAALSMALYGRPGGLVFASWWLIEISQRSLLMALAVFWRILALALAAVMLLGQLDPTLMADGLAQRAHLPARFVLGTLAGVRMLGLLSNDWRALRLARRARGLSASGVKSYASASFGLLVMAIRRGTKLATAMEVRGFSAQRAAHRTWARPSQFSAADGVGLAVTLAIDAASLLAACWAGTFWLIWAGASS